MLKYVFALQLYIIFNIFNMFDYLPIINSVFAGRETASFDSEYDLCTYLHFLITISVSIDLPHV